MSTVRKQIIQWIWGSKRLPLSLYPTQVRTNVPCPLGQLTGFVRVDELRLHMAPTLEGVAHHFVAAHPNRELVVVHHGHACTFEDGAGDDAAGYGMQRMVQQLLDEGYGVLTVSMPRMRPGDCTGAHETLFELQAQGNSMRYFLDTTLAGLNWLSTRGQRAGQTPGYRHFHMTGLSGGGWTTVLYAAVDPRIECSVPIAGSLPLYLRYGGSIGDREQWDAEFYRRFGYPTLYALGAVGRGRRQIQVLVRRDDCCFGEAQHDTGAVGKGYEAAVREYELKVQHAVAATGEGHFEVVIDNSATSHQVSLQTLRGVLLPGLRPRP